MTSVQFTTSSLNTYFSKSIGTKRSGGAIENLTNTVLGNTSGDLSAVYKSSVEIQNGSYYKLLRAYYQVQKENDTKKTTKTDQKKTTDTTTGATAGQTSVSSSSAAGTITASKQTTDVANTTTKSATVAEQTAAAWKAATATGVTSTSLSSAFYSATGKYYTPDYSSQLFNTGI